MPCPICNSPHYDTICPACINWQKEQVVRESASGVVEKTVILNGTTIGRYRRDVAPYQDCFNICSTYTPHIAVFCQSCGDLWLRVVNNYKFNYTNNNSNIWSVTNQLCLKCGGSLAELYADLLLTREELITKFIRLYDLLNSTKEPDDIISTSRAAIPHIAAPNHTPT